MQFDVIIIGGGMVGATLGLLLQETKLHIALVDATPENSPIDERLIALNDNSVSLFKNMGIWGSLAPFATPIHELHVSERGRFGVARIPAKLLNMEALGYVVPAKHINTVLYDTLATKNIKLLRPATLQGLSEHATGIDLSIETQQGTEQFTASKVIGADGSYSTVRKLLAIETDTFDYKQSALVTVTTLQRDHQHIAYERFQKTGAIAMLPLADFQVATIWTDQTETIQALMQLSPEDFLARLQRQFGYRLGRMLAVAKRSVYPLMKHNAKKQTTPHALLIGNAAHTLHPIAAQGLNLALYEVASLAEYFSTCSVTHAFPDKKDWFVGQHFSRQLSHRLAGLFSSEFFLMDRLRQIGLVGLDISDFLKKQFMKQALGQHGLMPRLLMRNVK